MAAGRFSHAYYNWALVQKGHARQYHFHPFNSPVWWVCFARQIHPCWLFFLPLICIIGAIQTMNASTVTNFSCFWGNLSLDYVTDEVWPLGDDQSEKHSVVVISSILVLFMLVEIPWNLVVLATLIYNKCLKQPSTFLLLTWPWWISPLFVLDSTLEEGVWSSRIMGPWIRKNWFLFSPWTPPQHYNYFS